MIEKRRKIGIMGGTFDPIHYGHLLIAQSAAEEFALEQVIFIPTGRSPHKAEVTDGERRCIMVQKAIADNKMFQLSKIELLNPMTSYTFETLQKLKERFTDADFYFIMGEDSLKDFDSWMEPGKICQLSTLLVAMRDDGCGKNINMYIDYIRETYHANIHKISSPNYSVSSADIRQRIYDGRSIRYLVPSSVEAFIHRENLYL